MFEGPLLAIAYVCAYVLDFYVENVMRYTVGLFHYNSLFYSAPNTNETNAHREIKNRGGRNLPHAPLASSSDDM